MDRAPLTAHCTSLFKNGGVYERVHGLRIDELKERWMGSVGAAWLSRRPANSGAHACLCLVRSGRRLVTFRFGRCGVRDRGGAADVVLGTRLVAFRRIAGPGLPLVSRQATSRLSLVFHDAASFRFERALDGNVAGAGRFARTAIIDARTSAAGGCDVIA